MSNPEGGGIIVLSADIKRRVVGSSGHTMPTAPVARADVNCPHTLHRSPIYEKSKVI